MMSSISIHLWMTSKKSNKAEKSSLHTGKIKIEDINNWTLIIFSNNTIQGSRTMLPTIPI